LYPDHDEFAKALRKRLTDSENKLWKFLRAKRLKRLKFRRQAPMGKYIVDFVCHEKKIIIEKTDDS
jgi:very-short-patch-repair endonuclease